MDDKIRAFLETNHQAVMVTLRKDGTPHVVKVTVGLVDGKIWSSGTQTRLRTKHLRRDPRATLLVLDETNTHNWLGIQSRVTIHDGPDAVDRNVALYQSVFGHDPEDMEEYRRQRTAQQRLIYEFTVERTYGLK